MSSHSPRDHHSVELPRLLKNWAAKNSPKNGGRKKLLQTVIRNQRKRRPNRIVVFIQGLSRPYWMGQPQMNYGELSKWLFNRAIIESLGTNHPELRLVT